VSTGLRLVGNLGVSKAEDVVISDPNFWKYGTDDDSTLLKWDPPEGYLLEDYDILLDISSSERKDEMEIAAVPASKMRKLNVGWTFKVYRLTENPNGCNPHRLPEINYADFDFSKAVIIERGQCTFLDKARNAKAAGYDFVIVVDRELVGQRITPLLVTDNDETVPENEVLPLVLVAGERDADLLSRAERVRIAGTRKVQRRMVVRGGYPFMSLLIWQKMWRT
jgi:PA domain